MVGKVLRQLRRESRITQEELARRAKIDRVYVSLLENDKNSPTLEVFCRVCKALGTKGSLVLARIERRSS
jgi:transcriptional regulator with XRE-family HTH domain